MATFRAELQPFNVEEWIAEDELRAPLDLEAIAPFETADPAMAKQMLDETVINLPQALDWCELEAFAQKHQTLGGLLVEPSTKNYSFYSVEVPVSIILPGKQNLVRLRLELELLATGHEPKDVVAYDLFPKKQIDVTRILAGEVNVDISKGLEYVLAAAAPALAPAAECLGLKVKAPFQWDSKKIVLQSSGRMSNPVQWYVLDQAIQNGFAPNAILRAPKGATVTVTTRLAGEVRVRDGLLRYKTQFHLPKPTLYVLQQP